MGNMSLLGEKMQEKSNRLPIHASDTAANSQDGLSPKFVAAAAARECNIHDARGGWLCKTDQTTNQTDQTTDQTDQTTDQTYQTTDQTDYNTDQIDFTTNQTDQTANLTTHTN